MKWNVIGVVAFALSGAAFLVQADTTYDLDSTQISGAASPFATVVLDQIGAGVNGAGEVQVTVTLDSVATQFVNGAGGSFSFKTDVNLTTASIPDLPTGVTWANSSSPGGGAGTYNNSLVCGTGCSGPTASPLTFDVSATNLTISDFVANGSNSFFATSVQTANGSGVVYGGTLTAAPEPRSYVLLLALGMLGLVSMRKWRDKPRQQNTEG